MFFLVAIVVVGMFIIILFPDLMDTIVLEFEFDDQDTDNQEKDDQE